MSQHSTTHGSHRAAHPSQPSTTALPWRGWAYLIPVQILGMVVLGHAIGQAVEQSDPRWLYLAVLTILSSLFSVRLSDSQARSGSLAMSAGDFFIFAAIVFLGPVAGSLMAALEGLMASWRLQVRHFYKLLFNVSHLVLSATLVGSFYKWLQPLRAESGANGLGGLLLSVLSCALLYFLVNSLLLGLAMVLVSRQPARQIARRGFLWALPANCVNVCLVAIAIALSNPLDVWLPAALIPLILVAYVLREAHLPADSESLADEQQPGLLQLPFYGKALPFKVRGYLYGILTLALPILIYCLHHSITVAGSKWLYLAALTAMASCFPLTLMALRDRIWLTLSDLFVFVALFEFGPEVATVIAAVDAVIFNLRRRPAAAYHWVFNVTQMAVTAFAVGHCFRFLGGLVGLGEGGQTGIPNLLVALAAPMLCGFLYYLSSLGLTAGAMSLATGEPFRQLWRRNVGWCYPSVLGALGGASAYLLIQNVPLGY